MDVFTMLREDHAKVRNLFKQYEACGDKELKKKQSIADTVFASFDTHIKVEEEENELFPKAKKDIADEIVKISSDSEERKEELEEKQASK